MTPWHLLRPTVWAVALACTTLAVGAQIRTDASLGRSPQTLVGPAYVVPEALGQRAGGNLFHSFQQFDLGQGTSATFTTESTGLRNVISRVTGGSASYINGTLALHAASGSPAFYFLNPAGVFFGNNAHVDVPGAFHVSTADGLRFPDGVWYADAAKASTFSSADPVDFGFLGPGRGPVQLQGSTLYPTEGQALTVVGSDVTLDAATLVSGEGGLVRIVAANTLSLHHGGKITTYTTGPAQAGDIDVRAAALSMDGRDSVAGITGITSLSDAQATGRTGKVSVVIDGPLQLYQGIITSSTFSTGDAGDVQVRAATVLLEGGSSQRSEGIYSNAFAGTGHAGTVQVQAQGALELSQGAEIASNTWSQGRGGSVQVQAGSIHIHGGYAGIYSESKIGAGKAGAGDIQVEVRGPLLVEDSGYISSATWSPGDAGAVRVAADTIRIDSLGSSGGAGIISDASASTGRAGTVDVRAKGLLEVTNQGMVSSNAYAAGRAGTVQIQAGEIRVNGGAGLFAGIFSDSMLTSTADAGSVQVQATGAITLEGGGMISSSTGSAHNAGAVQVRAQTLSIDGGSSGFGGIFSNSLAGGGAGGAVQVDVVGHLALGNGGVINSSTAGVGNAGAVRVAAGSISVDGGDHQYAGIFSEAYPGSTGRGGQVQVQSSGTLTLTNGAMVSSSTWGAGSAGGVHVAAGTLNIDGGASQYAGIYSQAALYSSGDAGPVQVTVAGPLEMVQGGQISSSTATRGQAGAVSVLATRVHIDGTASGISAQAMPDSSGQTGTVSLTATESIRLTRGGALSIRNDAQVTNPAALLPTMLRVSAPDIALTDSQITAAASGNADASQLGLAFGNHLSLERSQITTSAYNGNGGAIMVEGDGLLALKNSQITTSVAGLSGNGGDIVVRSRALALNTGMIQANTTARDATGGRVQIDVPALLPSAGALWLGGNTAYTLVPGLLGFNVIQAAAPTGISGRIDIATPALDLSNALRGLDAPLLHNTGLGHNPCETHGGSVLAVTGRGYYPVADYGWLGLIPWPPSDAAAHAKAPSCSRD